VCPLTHPQKLLVCQIFIFYSILFFACVWADTVYKKNLNCWTFYPVPLLFARE
jgi:hypothetical protein